MVRPTTRPSQLTQTYPYLCNRSNQTSFEFPLAVMRVGGLGFKNGTRKQGFCLVATMFPSCTYLISFPSVAWKKKPIDHSRHHLSIYRCIWNVATDTRLLLKAIFLTSEAHLILDKVLMCAVYHSFIQNTWIWTCAGKAVQNPAVSSTVSAFSLFHGPCSEYHTGFHSYNVHLSVSDASDV